MYHSDLRKEISYLQALLGYKREKLAAFLRKKMPLAELKGLHDEISSVEKKLQLCFEEVKAQAGNGD